MLTEHQLHRAGAVGMSPMCPTGPEVLHRRQVLLNPPQPFVLNEGGDSPLLGKLLGSFLERPLVFPQMDTVDVWPPPT